MVITDFQHYWKSKTDHGHQFTFAHGKDFMKSKTFTIEVKHSDKVRSADGSFRAEGTIATGGSQRAVESVNRRLRRTRQAEIERARRSGSPAQLRSARALPTRLSRDEASDLALRRERLIDAEVEGDDFFFEFEDSWEAWRIDYEEAGG